MTGKRTAAPRKSAARKTEPGSAGTDEKVRLHKFLAEAGVASRRASEKLIREGHVAVNGLPVIELPAWVTPGRDRVEVDGHPVGSRLSNRPRTYLMVNKPRRVICTNEDPEKRKRIVDLVPGGRRLFCVGRLDADSTGLVLLTDDGELANKLTHPRYGVSKTYQVTVRGRVTPDDLEKLRSGIILADRGGAAAKARAAAVRVLAADNDRTRMRITLREGRNREIRRMLARIGYKVQRLRRLALGPLELKGVASGEWRRLTPHEMRALRRAIVP